MKWSPLALLAAVACANENGVSRILVEPEVEITSPDQDAGFRQGQGAVVFEGLVTDTYDGPNSLRAFFSVDDGEPQKVDVDANDAVSWALDVDGLALGQHVTTLLARDSDDMETSVEVVWTLGAFVEGPTVTITAPDDGVTLPDGAEITFRGEAEDNNTDPAELTFVWTSSIDGVLPDPISGAGESVAFATLSAGTHVVTLDVTDVDGEVGSDAIEVTIAEIEEEPDPVAQVGDLVFSELMVNPEVVEDIVGEWVELYNTSSRPIAIDGYSFGDLGVDSYVITGGAVVPPLDYVVLCASVDPILNGGIPCDIGFLRSTYGGPGTMALGNSGDEVLLARPDGLVIDVVVYSGSWFTPAAATGLDPTQLDADNNDDESMWCSQATVTSSGGEAGTPGVANDACP